MIKWICTCLCIGFLSLVSAENTSSRDLTSITTSEDEPLLVGYDYIQVWNTVNNKKAIVDKGLYKLNTFTRLKNGEDQFSYYVLEELNWGYPFRSFLICEDYDSESAIWLANYDKDYNLIDALEVYYDNAEGAWTTTSKIYQRQHIIELTQYDVYAIPETSVKKVRIASNGKIEK